MDTNFIRIGDLYINTSRILSIDFQAHVWDRTLGVRIDMSEDATQSGTCYTWKGEEAQAVRDMLSNYLRSRTSHEVDFPAK